MATLDLQVSVSANDGFVQDTPAFDNTLNRMVIGNTGTLYSSWARFTGVSGLSGATIIVAFISYEDFDDGFGTGVPETSIYAEDATAPAAPTSAADYTGKATTTAFVTWNAALVDGWTNSPSIVTVIQELADSYDPSVIQILHKNTGSGASKFMRPKTWDNDTSLAPKLHIEYTAGGGAVPVFDHHYRIQRAA